MKIAIVIASLFMSAFASAQSTKTCATLSTAYRHSNGSSLSLSAGESIADLGDFRNSHGHHFDNRIARLDVAKGCTLVSYQYENFNIDYDSGRTLNGFVLVTEANPNYSRDPQPTFLDSYYQDKISSVKCFCQ